MNTAPYLIIRTEGPFPMHPIQCDLVYRELGVYEDMMCLIKRWKRG